MSCEICPIISNPHPEEFRLRLIEGEHWVATLRGNDQTLPGTSFITARRHVESLSSLTPSEQLEFFDIHAQLERAIMQAFGAAVINTSCLMNLAFREEDPEPHVHWHLKPRYAEPIEFAGHTFLDPEFGSYLSGSYPRKIVDNAVLNAIAAEIKASLS